MFSSAMILTILSATVVGFVHTLAPGHWLPVVLLAKAKRWPLRTALLGAVVAASGHIIISGLVGTLGVLVGIEVFTAHEEEIEKAAALVIAAFGLVYAILVYFRHMRCSGHTHHGPPISGKRGPFVFLFSLGFSPCVAVLPIFAASAAGGIPQVALTVVAFSLGVLTTLLGATAVAILGLMKLDHPLLEHYGDVISGLAICAMGLILFFVPH